jgi:hypothetical protein
MIRLARLTFVLVFGMFVFQATGVGSLVVDDDQCTDEPLGCPPFSCPTCVGCGHSLPTVLAASVSSHVLLAATTQVFRVADVKPRSPDPQEIWRVPKRLLG